MLPFGMKLFGKPHTTFPYCIGFSIFVFIETESYCGALADLNFPKQTGFTKGL